MFGNILLSPLHHHLSTFLKRTDLVLEYSIHDVLFVLAYSISAAIIGNPMWTIRDNLGSSSLIETTVSTFASKESAVLNSIQKICDAYAALEE